MQYETKEKRDWVVDRLMDIARLTGYRFAQSASEICENAWQKQQDELRSLSQTSKHADVPLLKKGIDEQRFRQISDVSKPL